MEWPPQAAAWLEQTQQPGIRKLDFEERLGLLVDAEHIYRKNRRQERPSAGLSTVADELPSTAKI